MSQTTTCSVCGHEIEFGQFPFCSKGGGPHEYMPGREPQQFQPIVVHRRKTETGEYVYSYPGRSDDPVPAGYEKVEFTSLAQIDRFTKDRDAEEMELRRMTISAERDHWNERAKERREYMRRELERRLGKSNSQIGDMVQRIMDAKREKRYQQLLSRGTNFHNQAISFDSSHRKEYRDDNNRKVSVVVQGLRR